MRIPRPRGPRGSRAIDLSELSSLIDYLGPGPAIYLGVVFKPPSESSHAEISDDDVLVHVTLMPDETPVLARLFAGGGGAGSGLWKVPKPGTEVVVAVPNDDVQSGPVIVCASASGTVPDGLDTDNMKIANADGDVDLTGSVVTINGTDYSLLKTEDFLGDLKTCIAAIFGANYTSGALVATNPPDIADFLLSLANAPLAPKDYRSSKAKNG